MIQSGRYALVNTARSYRNQNQKFMVIRKKILLRIAVGGMAYIVWFLACLSYIYGSLYLSPGRHAAFHVLAVDYDKGAVGQALQVAYTQLKGPGFVTLDFRSPSAYPTEADMFHAVWRGDYWASVAITEGASERLSAALQGGEAAATYDQSTALHYVWDQQYYTIYANTVVQRHMNQLVAATRLAYSNINGMQAMRIVNKTDQTAIQALLDPIKATETNIHAAAFGSVVFMNTVSMVMAILEQFFFLLTLNGIFGALNLYGRMTVLSSMCLRRLAGILFTFGAALCQSGYYWAFRENWEVNGSQFLLTWMAVWLLMQIHLLVMDSISTTAPPAAMPFVVLFWITLNNASAASPLDIQTGFYKWSIILPSHEAYSVLVTIWTGGAHNQVYRALPILFSWWIVANITASLAHIRACHLAYQLHRKQDTKRSAHRDVEAGLPLTSRKEDLTSNQK
ncbi:hypothetical protein COCVIDRAFT_116464 [Bipolaris victoriae FI3]|uniref:DUF3533 domain-containing protein n=1 Tax=Bipolaris victoriae (strain FI3) TaxID=930091 RepID=W7E0I3_BIPV3|nr:hypothetical protein COCVIDRAFT_116464 [Bipolaris victoriae FI3]